MRHSRAANSAVRGRIEPNFELIRDIIVGLLIYKNEDDLIKNEGARVLTRLFIDFSHTQGAANSAVRGGIPPEFVLIQAFRVVLVTCKNGEDPVKNKGGSVLTTFSHYKSIGIFSDAHGHLTPQSLVESGRNSNSSEILLLTSPPAN